MDIRRGLARLAAVATAALAVAPSVPAVARPAAARPTSSTTAAPTTTAPSPPTTAPGPVRPAAIGAPYMTGGLLVGDALGVVDPSLAGVAVEGAELRAADAAVRAADAATADAEAAIVAAEAAIRDADVAVATALAEQRRWADEVVRREAVERDVQMRIDRLSAVERASARALEVSRRLLQQLAVASYVAGGDVATFDSLLSSDSTLEYGRRELFGEIADDRLQDRIAAYQAARDEASAGAARAAEELAVARRETDAARQSVADALAAEAAWLAERAARVVARDRRVAERDQWVAERADRVAERADATVLAWVVGADFPLVVLDAYQRAAVAAGRDGCTISWTVLAGIGRVESRHGTYSGATVDDAGGVAPPIIGIPLTGENGTAAIGDTDAGHFDGDTVHDRAVGPMQFIPSTWRAYGRDADGEGTADPQNLYDAAAAAAEYLCRAGGGALTSESSMTRAFLAYNHSDAYARTVLSYALAYAGLDLPVG